jgi:hypothetical protein
MRGLDMSPKTSFTGEAAGVGTASPVTPEWTGEVGAVLGQITNYGRKNLGTENLLGTVDLLSGIRNSTFGNLGAIFCRKGHARWVGSRSAER